MRTDLRDRFRALHADGLFVMPNPWDVGAARLLADAGFPALATTSAGHARTLGRADQRVNRDELLVHAARWPPRSTCRSASTPSGASPMTPPAWPRPCG